MQGAHDLSFLHFIAIKKIMVAFPPSLFLEAIYICSELSVCFIRIS